MTQQAVDQRNTADARANAARETPQTYTLITVCCEQHRDANRKQVSQQIGDVVVFQCLY